MSAEYRIGRLNGRFVVTWWGEDGKRRRHRLDAQSRAEAEGAALDFIRDQRAKTTGYTIDALWSLYREEKKGRRIATAMEFEWRKMKPFFGHLRPDQVSIDMCRAYTAMRREMGKHDGTIWTELGHLRTVFLWAASRKLIEYAPATERPQKPAPKDRWLTGEEATRLIEAADAPHIKLAIQLMLETAGRVGAILELTWERVDLERKVVNLRTTDIGPRKGRAVVPINDGLRAALASARAASISEGGYVIEWAGKPVKSIKTGFKAAVKAAGLEDVTPHTLRHTAAVHLAAAGRPMERISQYLGHSSVHITAKVYARFAPDHLREEAAVLDFTPRAKVV